MNDIAKQKSRERRIRRQVQRAPVVKEEEEVFLVKIIAKMDKRLENIEKFMKESDTKMDSLSKKKLDIIETKQTENYEKQERDLKAITDKS